MRQVDASEESDEESAFLLRVRSVAGDGEENKKRELNGAARQPAIFNFADSRGSGFPSSAAELRRRYESWDARQARI